MKFIIPHLSLISSHFSQNLHAISKSKSFKPIASFYAKQFVEEVSFRIWSSDERWAIANLYVNQKSRLELISQNCATLKLPDIISPIRMIRPHIMQLFQIFYLWHNSMVTILPVWCCGVTIGIDPSDKVELFKRLICFHHSYRNFFFWILVKSFYSYRTFV